MKKILLVISLVLVSLSAVTEAAWAQVSADPSFLDFGDVPLEESKTLSLFVSNTSMGSVTIDDVVLLDSDGVFSTDFEVAVSLPSEGDFFILDVTFTPNGPINFFGSVRIDYSASSCECSTSLFVSIFGDGVLTTTLDFGNVPVGDEQSVELTLTNGDSESLTILEVFLVSEGQQGSKRAPDFSFTSDLQIPTVLAPSEVITFDITFAPLTAGLHEDVLRIEGDFPNEDNFTAEALLEGVGTFPDIDVDPTAIDFGNIVVDGLGSETLVITNDGEAPLVVNNVAIIGPNAGAFNAASGGFLLNPGASRNLSVRFSPERAGIHNATLRITSNDPDDPLLNVPLRGNGAELTLDINVEALDFSQIRVGEEATMAVRITNPGVLPVNVADFEISGPGADRYEVELRILSKEQADDETPSPPLGLAMFNVDPGQTQILDVTFAPDARGTFDALLELDTEAGLLAVSLTGQGIAPAIDASVEALAFGASPVGTPVRRAFDLGNIGELLLQAQLSITGGNGQFTLDGAAALPVDPAGSVSVGVTYLPADEGARTATLRIASNDPARPNLSIGLSGEGLPSLEGPQEIAFGAVRIGQPATEDLTLVNPGGVNVRVDRLSLSGSDAFSLSETGPLDIAPGAEASVTVGFDPTTRGTETAQLLIETTEGTLLVKRGQATLRDLDIGLSGQGVASGIAANPTAVAFGLVTLGRDVPRALAITNTGNADLNVAEVRLEGADTDVFRLDDASPFVLAPEATQTLTVFFNPLTPGGRAASVRFLSDALETPDLVVALSGNGEAIEDMTEEQGMGGVDTPISVVVPADFMPTSGRVFFRMGGQQAYQFVDVSGQGNTFSGAIPASALTERGVQYYVELTDGADTVTFPTINPEDNPEQIRVRIASLAAPLALSPEVNRMVSVPLALDASGITSIFEDDYGPYNPSTWRVQKWQPGPGAYAEFPAVNALGPPGTAVWLVTSEGQGFDVEAGTSVDLASPQQVALEAGWNQVGVPYAFAIARGNIDGLGGVQGPFFWTGTDYDPTRPTMDPWEGYFIFSDAQRTLVFNPIASSAVQAAKEEVGLEEVFPGAGYTVQLAADLPRLGLRDGHTYLGFAESASVGRDALDWPEPPGIGEHLRVSVAEEGRRYASGFKPLQAGGQTWNVEIEALLGSGRLVREEVDVRLIEHGIAPEDLTIVILDGDSGDALSVAGGRFTVTLTEGRPVRRLRVVLGTSAYAEEEKARLEEEVPGAFVLRQNYPNPFNPETVIAYELGEERAVVVDVYNVLGQRVRRLIDTVQGRGRYEVRWDGRDEGGNAVSSGLYLYRIEAGGFIASRTMTLVR